MQILAELDWSDVLDHYDQRAGIGRMLRGHLADGNVDAFARLAVGVDDPKGNYSAHEHGLGRKVLGSNRDAAPRLAELGDNFRLLTDAHDVPKMIRDAGLKYLGISVGSEISCLLNPEICWVANSRTIWLHLLVKHADNVDRANEELRLYRTSDADSEMAYTIWREIHRELGVSLTRIAEGGIEMAERAGLKPKSQAFLWADAIASDLYELRHAAE